MRYIVLLSVLLLSGCASQLLQPSQMTPEQLAAWAKVKDATMGCAQGTYAGARVVATWANVDKGIPSGITIDTDCKITFSAPQK